MGNISRAFGDTDIDDINGLFDTDDLAWRVSSEINNVSDVESESEDSPVILKQGERLKTGKVEQVKVISCSSPGHVVGRPVVWEVHYYRMIEDLTGYCEVTSPTTRISVGTGVGVKIDNLGWIRALCFGTGRALGVDNSRREDVCPEWAREVNNRTD